MPNAPTSSLLAWFAEHEPERTHCAGALVFVDLDLGPVVIDRVESAGMSIRRARGFAVEGALARPIPGQVIEPSGEALLDCETPSGATCGSVRRTIRAVWAACPPVSGRHMLLLDLDENDISLRSFEPG